MANWHEPKTTTELLDSDLGRHIPNMAGLSMFVSVQLHILPKLQFCVIFQFGQYTKHVNIPTSGLKDLIKVLSETQLL